MNRQEKIFLAGLVVFSLLTSFIFTFYGLSVTLAKEVPQWISLFAYVTAGYGVGNLYILSWAWRSGVKWAADLNMVMAFCFLGAFTMDTVKKGVESGLEIIGILVLALVLWVNWLAVKKVLAQKS